jgi:hypothetical protein
LYKPHEKQKAVKNHEDDKAQQSEGVLSRVQQTKDGYPFIQWKN